MGIFPYLSQMQREIINSSDEVYILADSSKFGKSSLVKTCDINEKFTYISDSSLSNEIKRNLQIQQYPNNYKRGIIEWKNHRQKNKFLSASLLFMFLYLISYVTRINYGAVISEICAAENMQKSLVVARAYNERGNIRNRSACKRIFLGDRLNPQKAYFRRTFCSPPRQILQFRFAHRRIKWRRFGR
ncbi:MAG: hypothetical protein L6V93_04845 [Clostridiales bacterium]|nr:MAG: hypothetical protein L6V93_04845 [Clostridiales bacterium]